MNYTQLCAAIQSYTENTFTATELATFTQQTEQKIYNSVQLPSLRKNVIGVTSPANKYVACPNDFLSVFSLAIYSYATPTATGTSGLNTITVSSNTNIVIGQSVTGTGIGTGALVIGIAGTTISLSVVNSGTVSGSMIFQGEYTYLLDKDVNFIRESYTLPNYTGLPQYYAIFGPQYTYPAELSLILGPTPDKAYNMELHYFYYPESIVTSGTTWLGDNFDTALLNGCLCEAITFMKGEQDLVALYTQRYSEAMLLLKQLGDGKERGDAYRDGQIRYPVK